MDTSFLGYGWVQIILIGFCAGLLARFILPGKQKIGLIMTTILGICGAIVASWLVDVLSIPVGSQWMRFAAAVVGSVGLLAIFNSLKHK